MAPIGIAIIGGGIFVREEHLPAVLENPGLSLKVIYSRSLKSAKETAALIPSSHAAAAAVDLYSDDSGADKTYHDVLLREDVHGVIIALPIRNQPEYIEAALTAGKHVLAEKPVGPDVAAAQKLIKFYDGIKAEKNVTLSIAEQFRFMPKFVWTAQEARKLGPMTNFACKNWFYMSPEDKYYNTAWRKDPTHPFGFALDGGVHWAAAIRLFLGDDRVKTVVGLSNTATAHLPAPDTLHAVFTTRSGAVGTYAYSCASSICESEIIVACEKGSVRLVGDHCTITRADGSTEERSFEGFKDVKAEVDAWADALAAGKPDPMASPEEALGDLELLEAMLKSGEAGGTVQTLSLQV